MRKFSIGGDVLCTLVKNSWNFDESFLWSRVYIVHYEGSQVQKNVWKLLFFFNEKLIKVLQDEILPAQRAQVLLLFFSFAVYIIFLLFLSLYYLLQHLLFVSQIVLLFFTPVAIILAFLSVSLVHSTCLFFPFLPENSFVSLNSKFTGSACVNPYTRV